MRKHNRKFCCCSLVILHHAGLKSVESILSLLFANVSTSSVSLVAVVETAKHTLAIRHHQTVKHTKSEATANDQRTRETDFRSYGQHDSTTSTSVAASTSILSKGSLQPPKSAKCPRFPGAIGHSKHTRTLRQLQINSLCLLLIISLLLLNSNSHSYLMPLIVLHINVGLQQELQLFQREMLRHGFTSVT